jgi:thioredoxin reductase
MPEVAIVGGGPAGLAAAIELRRLGVGEVVVIEREREAGGIPRHARHQGFGLRDLRRPLSGPAYARRYAERAAWPGAVVLATGCRERPRSARLVPGSRPEGVMTTGTLQQLVYLQGLPAGKRALIVGAEHVSFSAVMTLAHGGARAVALTTTQPRHQSLAAFRLGARLRYGAPVWTRTRVSAIRGRPRVEEVELTDLSTGASRTVECDTVIFSDDWVPDNELAVIAGLELDPPTGAPVVDAALRASTAGVFAAGNLLHGAEQADVAALSGRHVARSVARYLQDGDWPARRVAVLCETPLRWVSPNAVSGADPPPRGRFLLRASEFLRAPRIELTQGERTVWSRRVSRVMPGRSTGLPHGWARDIDPAGEHVVCRLRRPG